MKLRTYNVLRGYYDEVKEKELHIPEGAKFLYKDGICGDVVHTGHNHYMVILRKKDYTSKDIKAIIKADTASLIGYDEFDDLHILTIRDIKFLEEYPVITAEEVMSEFNIGKYYVLWKKKDYLDDDTLSDISSGKITFKEGISLAKQGKIYKCGKILNFAGPYSITMAIVHTGNYFDDRPTYGIDIVNNIDFTNISPDYIDRIAKDKIIVTKDPSYFEQLKNEVLGQIDNYIE